MTTAEGEAADPAGGETEVTVTVRVRVSDVRPGDVLHGRVVIGRRESGGRVTVEHPDGTSTMASHVRVAVQRRSRIEYAADPPAPSGATRQPPPVVAEPARSHSSTSPGFHAAAPRIGRARRAPGTAPPPSVSPPTVPTSARRGGGS